MLSAEIMDRLRRESSEILLPAALSIHLRKPCGCFLPFKMISSATRSKAPKRIFPHHQYVRFRGFQDSFVIRLLAQGAARMHAFSAADLISPAIKRTKWFLFDQFRWTTYLKLCFVAALTEGGFSGKFNLPGGAHGGGANSNSTPAVFVPHHIGISPLAIALIAAIVIVILGVSLVVFYLITRLRFALFYSLVYRTRAIRPGWTAYESQSWRFFLLSLAVSVLFLCAVAVAAIPFILGFYRMFTNTQPGEHFNWSGFFALLLPLIPVFIAIVLIGIAIQIILHDLMLPHMALENVSAGEAWRQVRARITSEKGGFALFAALRIILPIAAGILAIFVLLIPAILLVLLFALPVLGLAALVGSSAGMAKAAFILLIAAVVAVGIAILIVLGVSVTGPIGIGSRNYALLFYGGRYQALGDLLDPPPAQVAAPSL